MKNEENDNNITNEIINAMAKNPEDICQYSLKLIEEHCLTCDFYYRNRCATTSYNFCFNIKEQFPSTLDHWHKILNEPPFIKQIRERAVKKQIDEIRRLSESKKIEEIIEADILTIDECYLKYTRNPKTRELEVTRLDPATIVFTAKKEEKKGD